jgi:hypothetical protein
MIWGKAITVTHKPEILFWFACGKSEIDPKNRLAFPDIAKAFGVPDSPILKTSPIYGFLDC